jgi:hypothetical protein
LISFKWKNLGKERQSKTTSKTYKASKTRKTRKKEGLDNARRIRKTR